MDVDKNGQLSKKELAPLAKRLKVRNLFELMDEDDSGLISFSEFANYLA